MDVCAIVSRNTSRPEKEMILLEREKLCVCVSTAYSVIELYNYIFLHVCVALQVHAEKDLCVDVSN